MSVCKAISPLKASNFPFELMRTIPQLSGKYIPFFLENSFIRLCEFPFGYEKQWKLELWGEISVRLLFNTKNLPVITLSKDNKCQVSKDIYKYIYMYTHLLWKWNSTIALLRFFCHFSIMNT